MSLEGEKTPAEKPSPLDSEMQLIRILDRTLRSRYPDGVSLLKTLEGGLLIELHRYIDQPFNPHACAKAPELTDYLWAIKRVPTVGPGGGITIRGKKAKSQIEATAGRNDKYIIGRQFFEEAEVEYRLIHGLIGDALGRET